MVKGVSREGQKRLEGEDFISNREAFHSRSFEHGECVEMVKGVSGEGQKRLEGEDVREESASARGNSFKSQSNLVGHGRGVGGERGSHR